MVKKIIVLMNLYNESTDLTYFEWDNLNQKLKPYGVILTHQDGGVKLIDRLKKMSKPVDDD